MKKLLMLAAMLGCLWSTVLVQAQQVTPDAAGYIVKAMLGCLWSTVPVQAQQVTPDAAGYIVKVGDTAPDFEMTLTDGQKVKLSDLRGKVVMLQFNVTVYGELVWRVPEGDAFHREGYLAEAQRQHCVCTLRHRP